MREPPGPLWGRAASCCCVAPRVFRAPRGLLRRWCSGRRVACLDGPGRCVCWWAAARPRDRHTRVYGSEWSISRPALALPPPTGTAAWPRGGLPSVGACCLCPTCPGSAATHRHRDQAPHPAITHTIPAPTPNFACNSPTTVSNLESTTLELQRFQTLLKLHPIELHATFA